MWNWRREESITYTTDWSLWLSSGANIAEVVTAIGVVASLSYIYRRRARRRCLENYLKEVKIEDAKAVSTVFELGRRNLAELTAQLGMTKAQVEEAGFGNRKRVRSFAATDDKTGRPNTLFFQYIGDE